MFSLSISVQQWLCIGIEYLCTLNTSTSRSGTRVAPVPGIDTLIDSSLSCSHEN